MPDLSSLWPAWLSGAGTGAWLTFQWPRLLWLLLLVPLLAVAHAWFDARRRNSASAGSLLEPVDAAGAGIPASRWRERIPRLLWIVALAALILAIARPQAIVPLPTRMETVILAMDVSGSMRATDLKPNRIAAAQDAAKAFIADQPAHVRVGIVAVAGTAALTQAPTRNREELMQALERIQLQRGTAIGSGLLISLVTLMPHTGINADEIINGPRAGDATPGKELWWRKKADAPVFEPVEPGSNGQAAIVLLSDGQSNTGPDVMKVVQLAAERGVRIFTVGMGTPEGITLTAEGWSMRVRLDEAALKKIAAATEGEYFRAANAKELSEIYRGLSRTLTFDKQTLTEVTALFVAIGAFSMAIAAGLSMLWFGRIL
jgi:Ca-activated chloride channel family protein